MRSKHNLTAATLVTAAVALLLTPSIVRAIVYGFVDTNNVFTNTGAFIVKSPTTCNIFPICSGTLISPTIFSPVTMVTVSVWAKAAEAVASNNTIQYAVTRLIAGNIDGLRLESACVVAAHPPRLA